MTDPAIPAILAELAELRRMIERVPVLWPTYDSIYDTATVRFGTNFIKPSGAASSLYGLKYKVGMATITSVPTLTVSANLANTYDGLAWTADGNWLICGPCTDVNGVSYNAVPVSCPVGQPIVRFIRPIILPCAAGGTASVYRVYSL